MRAAIAAAAALVGLLVGGPVRAQLRAGDVVVTQMRGLLRVDPATGVVMPLPTAVPLVQPVGVLGQPDGSLLVADWFFGGDGGALLRVDPLTGAVAVVHQGPPLATPFALAARPDGRVVFVDIDSGTQHHLASGVVVRQGDLFDLDPASGTLVRLVHDCCDFNPTALVIDAPEHAWAVDAGCCAYAGDGALASVDLADGSWSRVPLPVLLRDPFGIVAAPQAGDLLVGESASVQGGVPALYRITPATGAVTTLAAGLPLIEPRGMLPDGDGALVADVGAVRRVDAATGAVATVASHPLLGDLQAMARVEAGGPVAGRPPRDPTARACAERTARSFVRAAQRAVGCERLAEPERGTCVVRALTPFRYGPAPVGCDPCLARNREVLLSGYARSLAEVVAAAVEGAAPEPRCLAVLARGVGRVLARRASDDRAVLRGAAPAAPDDGRALAASLAGAGCPAAVTARAPRAAAATASIVDVAIGAWYCAP